QLFKTSGPTRGKSRDIEDGGLQHSSNFRQSIRHLHVSRYYCWSNCFRANGISDNQIPREKLIKRSRRYASTGPHSYLTRSWSKRIDHGDSFNVPIGHIDNNVVCRRGHTLPKYPTKCYMVLQHRCLQSDPGYGTKLPTTRSDGSPVLLGFHISGRSLIHQFLQGASKHD